MYSNKKILNFFCSGFGIGYFPFFPGTIASLFILPFLWLLKENFTISFIFFIILVYTVISYVLLRLLKNDKKNMDPSFIVCDEYIGQSLAILFCSQKITDYLLAFLIFRFLDIYKPFPISYFDNMKNEYGVLLDDIVAGLITTFIFYIHYD